MSGEFGKEDFGSSRTAELASERGSVERVKDQVRDIIAYRIAAGDYGKILGIEAAVNDIAALLALPANKERG